MSPEMIRAQTSDSTLVRGDSPLDDVIAEVWKAGGTPEFTRSAMLEALDRVFSTGVRALERHDRPVLSWMANRLSGLAGRLLRDESPSPSVYFGVYMQALGDISYALTSDEAALETLHARVKQNKHVLPLLATLNRAQSQLTASQIANALSLKAPNFTSVLSAALDAGVVSCDYVGRHKYCSITRLGQSYLEEVSRPAHQFLSRKLLEEFWILAMRAPDGKAAMKVVFDAYPAIPERSVRNLLEAATNVDGFMVAVDKVRAELEIGSEWLVVFLRSESATAVFKRNLATNEIDAIVLDNTPQYVRFRNKEDDVDLREFDVPYRLLFDKDVSFRRAEREEQLELPEPASVKGIVDSVLASQAELACAI